MRRTVRAARLLLPLLPAAAALQLLPGAGGAHAAGPALPVFGHPVTVDPQRMVGEPDDTVGADGRIYVSAPWAVTTATSFIWRSEDGGEQFRQIQAAPGVQNPYPWRAGGDTEIQAFPPAGPSFTGESTASPTRLYFADQNNLDSNTCGFSDNAGRSFTFTGGLICPQNAGADRQWITQTRIDPAVAANGGLLTHDISYMWYDNADVSGIELLRSDDGQSYTLASRPSGVTGNPGNTVADRSTGVVYMTAPASGGGAAVVYSADGGATTATVDVPLGASTSSIATDFSVLAIDTAGNLYIIWSNQNGTNQWRTWVSHTTGFTAVSNPVRTVSVAGATPSEWSTPVQITGTGSANPTINYSVFPWIDAGDPGRINAVFYGTDHTVPYDPNSQAANWSTYMVQSLDATPSNATPTFSSAVSVGEAPTHLASICFNGIGCTGTGNRNLLDFFEVRHDGNGMAVIAYDDDANSLTALFPGGPQVMTGHQVGGPSLFTSVGSLSGTPTPRTFGVSDRSGDGLYPTSDTSVPALDLLGTSAQLADASTLEVTFTVANLASAVTSIPPTEGATGITYVLNWKFNNDLWFVAAHVDAAGQFTFEAGLPGSVPFTGTGGPKFIVYDTNSRGSPVTTGSANVSTGVITIDVPTSMLGGLTVGSTLLRATGFSLVDRSAPNTTALSDGADETASFDDRLLLVTATVPESTWTALLVLTGLGVAGVAAWRRRRRSLRDGLGG